MIKLIFLISFLLSSTAVAASFISNDKSELNILVNGKDVQVNLPKEAFDALKKWNSNFTLFDRENFTPATLELFAPKEQPMVFIGDLEGKGRKSVVLFGQDSKAQHVVALINDGKKWNVIKIYSSNIPNIKMSEVPTIDEGKEIGIPYYIIPAEGDIAKKLNKKIGIQIEAYLGYTEVYEIKNGKALKFSL